MFQVTMVEPVLLQYFTMSIPYIEHFSLSPFPVSRKHGWILMWMVMVMVNVLVQCRILRTSAW